MRTMRSQMADRLPRRRIARSAARRYTRDQPPKKGNETPLGDGGRRSLDILSTSFHLPLIQD
jgi:hypothetical protein